MTTEAQNCLLKTLEEPPEYLTIILICSNDNNLLSTIKSRCIRMYFEPLSDENIREYLESNYKDNIKEKDLIEIIKMAEEIYKTKEEIQSILEYMNVLALELSKKNIKYIKCIEIVEETKKRLKANSNYDMCIDNMLFNIWEEINEKDYRSQI